MPLVPWIHSGHAMLEGVDSLWAPKFRRGTEPLA